MTNLNLNLADKSVSLAAASIENVFYHGAEVFWSYLTLTRLHLLLGIHIQISGYGRTLFCQVP